VQARIASGEDRRVEALRGSAGTSATHPVGGPAAGSTAPFEQREIQCKVGQEIVQVAEDSKPKW